MEHKPKGIYEAFVKRIIDILGAIIIILLFCWLYVLIAVLVRLKLGSPTIFSQERPGLIDRRTGKETVFRLYKFRTMTDERDENGELLPGHMRETSFGNKLRSMSVDELPEVINILKGEMSFVGPRPLAVVYLPYYSEIERRRHLVRPGLTGLAQVSGRNAITWEEKFKYDVAYVDNVSFVTDFRIIIATIKTVFSREGVGQGETSPESFHLYRQRQIDTREK